MSTKTNYCFNQIQKMMGLQYFSALGKEGLKQLVSTLSEVTLNDHHANAVVEEWMREQTNVATPADLRRIAQSLRPIYAPKAGEYEACSVCSGTGWVVYYQEYKPFVRHGHCRDHVRNPMESDGEFIRRMEHYKRDVMPEGRILSESAMRCTCAAGMARQKRDDAA